MLRHPMLLEAFFTGFLVATAGAGTAATTTDSLTHLLEPFFSPASLISDPVLAATPALHAGPLLHAMHARQAGCAASYTPCTNLNRPSICCQPDTVCTTDEAAMVACCPRGAACTGTIGGNAGSATAQVTATAAGGGGGEAGASTLTVTVTAGYSAPMSITGGGGGSGDSNPTGTVPNAPFAFAYIPHSFSNAAQCLTYYTSCRNTFSSCTAALGGSAGGGGVTVVGAGITTANGAGSSGDSASAASVCSSLSSQACYGLQTPQCSAYGTAGSNDAAGRRCAAGDVAKVGAGFMLGMLGVGVV